MKFAFLFAVCLPAIALAQSPQRVSVKPCPDRVAVTTAPDVAYQGGIDASGNPVAPADLGRPAAANEQLENPTVSLDIPLDRITGNKAAQKAGGFATFGQVQVVGNQATLNGESLSPPDACPD